MSKESIVELLHSVTSRFTIDQLVFAVGSNETLFAVLVENMLAAKEPVNMRAAWAVSVITDKQPWLLNPYIEQLASNIPSFSHPAIVRSILRYFCTNPLPGQKMGAMLNLCYSYLLNLKMPAAIRVYAMQIIFNISEIEPDLKEELRLTLENLYDTGSPGFQNRAGKLLQKLNRKR